MNKFKDDCEFIKRYICNCSKAWNQIHNYEYNWLHLFLKLKASIKIPLFLSSKVNCMLRSNTKGNVQYQLLKNNIKFQAFYFAMSWIAMQLKFDRHIEYLLSDVDRLHKNLVVPSSFIACYRITSLPFYDQHRKNFMKGLIINVVLANQSWKSSAYPICRKHIH